MILVALKKAGSAQIGALRFLALHQPIALIDPPPDLEIAMQAVYNGLADIFKSGKEKPGDIDRARAVEKMAVDAPLKIKLQNPQAPPFRFNDRNFEEWRKAHQKTDRGDVYFGFADRPKVIKAMKKVNLIVGGPGELVTLAEQIKNPQITPIPQIKSAQSVKSADRKN